MRILYDVNEFLAYVAYVVDVYSESSDMNKIYSIRYRHARLCDETSSPREEEVDVSLAHTQRNNVNTCSSVACPSSTNASLKSEGVGGRINQAADVAEQTCSDESHTLQTAKPSRAAKNPVQVQDSKGQNVDGLGNLEEYVMAITEETETSARQDHRAQRKAYSTSDIPAFFPTTSITSRGSFRFFPCTEVISDEEIVVGEGHAESSKGKKNDEQEGVIQFKQVEEKDEAIDQDVSNTYAARATTDTQLLRKLATRPLPTTPNRRNSMSQRRCSLM